MFIIGVTYMVQMCLCVDRWEIDQRVSEVDNANTVGDDLDAKAKRLEMEATQYKQHIGDEVDGKLNMC
jgi:hypothetical protein